MAQHFLCSNVVWQYSKQKQIQISQVRRSGHLSYHTRRHIESRHNFCEFSGDIKDSNIYTILLSRKSLLFSTNGVWIKHSGFLLDETMETYDRGEICEFVGLFLLDKLSSIIHMKNIGLRSDDGLAVIRKVPGPRKKLIVIYKKHSV